MDKRGYLEYLSSFILIMGSTSITPAAMPISRVSKSSFNFNPSSFILIIYAVSNSPPVKLDNRDVRV